MEFKSMSLLNMSMSFITVLQAAHLDRPFIRLSGFMGHIYVRVAVDPYLDVSKCETRVKMDFFILKRSAAAIAAIASKMIIHLFHRTYSLKWIKNSSKIVLVKFAEIEVGP